ncbi:hypothetical protein PVA45_07480 (plasmid) [Entomospira entomophila]|uniref:Uncharacterized protein n=1 Tax=Entomospira entomophila TaxID=2719988 RepID=A0A968GF44_9SPIO|nr:hypothetical protein [Entomospira entomophilus]NIZ41299.1 hypothetical protein [Entomospira entomophilus]WDI36178.1 hypothetical protein PVA45_07480 [Entomospira entomophilus]
MNQPKLGVSLEPIKKANYPMIVMIILLVMIGSYYLMHQSKSPTTENSEVTIELESNEASQKTPQDENAS